MVNYATPEEMENFLRTFVAEYTAELETLSSQLTANQEARVVQLVQGGLSRKAALWVENRLQEFGEDF